MFLTYASSVCLSYWLSMPRFLSLSIELECVSWLLLTQSAVEEVVTNSVEMAIQLDRGRSTFVAMVTGDPVSEGTYSRQEARFSRRENVALPTLGAIVTSNKWARFSTLTFFCFFFPRRGAIIHKERRRNSPVVVSWWQSRQNHGLPPVTQIHLIQLIVLNRRRLDLRRLQFHFSSSVICLIFI